MKSWREVPFFRLILPLILGIILQDYFNWNWKPILGTSFLIIFLFSSYLFSSKKRSFSQRHIFGITLFMGLIILGSFFSFLKDDRHQLRHYKSLLDKNITLEGEVTWIKPTTKYLRVILKVKKVHLEGQHSQDCTGNLLTYIPLSARSMNISLGTSIAIEQKAYSIAQNKNPKAFNFARYWHLKNIHFQSFPKDDNWHISDKVSAFSVFNTAQTIRKKLLKILRSNLPTDNEFGVGASLILGEKSDLSSQVRAAFTQTGSMHVLAVSGLHTGLVFLFAQFILSLFRIKKKWWNWLKTALLILAVWSFAFLTGATASVLRSATMFSFIIIGSALSRSALIYNTLAASAFCLLIFEPKMLFEPGFQLSYLAVLGIVYFQPKIYKTWYIKNKIGDYIWKLSSVSIAAQIVTLPLSLFYFHQFPVYFLLSGLIVIPAAMVILPLGFALFITNSIPFLGVVIGKILYGVIWLVNSMIFQINALPFGLIHGIWIGGIVISLLYLMIISSIGFIETKKAKWLIIGLLALNGILLGNTFLSWNTLHQNKMVIYHVPKASLIDIIYKNEVTTLSSELLSTKKIDFAAANYRGFSKVQTKKTYSLSDAKIIQPTFQKQKQLLQFKQNKIIILSKGFQLPSQKINATHLLITDNAISSIKDIQTHYNFDTIIFDGSSSYSKIKKWKEEVELLGIKAHFTGDKGALIIL